MAIVENTEIWYPKLDPKRPNGRYNKENPTWELQIRTEDKDVKKAWEALGLRVKPIIPDEEGAKPYYRVNLRKSSFKKSGEAAQPVEVVDGNLEPIDPRIIGNGSIGNVRIFQYEYPASGGGTLKASVLMKVQITKLIKYTPTAQEEREDFAQTDYEVVDPDTASDEDF